jgi:hypothetical protein
MTSKTAKIVVVLAAAGALSGIGAGLAAADSPTAASTNYTVEGMREYIKPSASITVPSMSCGGGYLEDKDYSPGRLVPRGVEVIEPGGVGVTITHPKYGYMDPTGSYWPLIGTDEHRGWSHATNWDPFTGHELQITLHCTTDINQAAKKTFVPGFPTP